MSCVILVDGEGQIVQEGKEGGIVWFTCGGILKDIFHLFLGFLRLALLFENRG